jgi:hypothetical protein
MNVHNFILENYLSLTETSKATKQKQDEALAKEHGIDLKKGNYTEFQKLAQAKHDSRKSEYEKDSDGNPNYEHKTKYDHRSIQPRGTLTDKNGDQFTHEVFTPKSKRTRVITKTSMNPIDYHNNPQLEPKKPTMADAPKAKKYGHGHLERIGNADFARTSTTSDELFKKKVASKIKADRHTQITPEGDRTGINERKKKMYAFGKKRIRDGSDYSDKIGIERMTRGDSVIRGTRAHDPISVKSRKLFNGKTRYGDQRLKDEASDRFRLSSGTDKKMEKIVHDINRKGTEYAVASALTKSAKGTSKSTKKGIKVQVKRVKKLKEAFMEGYLDALYK